MVTLESFGILFPPEYVGQIASCTAEWRDGNNGIVLGFIPYLADGQRIWYEGKFLEFFPKDIPSFVLKNFGKPYTTIVKENRCIVQWEK